MLLDYIQTMTDNFIISAIPRKKNAMKQELQITLD